MVWQAHEIRQAFFDFFESKNHQIVPSAPIVVKDDPTLMFVNAGMNQFKDYFLGNRSAQQPRIANTQKCLRVSGKHNDLEEVGVDTYHHTMFEMLGNWSFGNYFKQEAISWAWELLTEVYKINKNNLYVTVFKGDETEGLNQDIEAIDIWKKHITTDRILEFGKKDNFWEMGDVGPCGPCSEIHIDLRTEQEKAKIPGHKLVNTGHPQVIEIWNLVFIQFNRNANGKLLELPAKHVDTGMGLERLAVVLQNKNSNYDTDIFTPIITQIENLTGISYNRGSSKQDVAFRVICDHLRAVAFTIADGQLPSNTGAGYVIRRILRRAIRYGYSFLDLKEPFIYALVTVLVKQFGHIFPEIKAQEVHIKKVIKEEEENFLRTLSKGIDRLKNMVDQTTGNVIDGAKIFELYDTYGFPFDLTALILAESNKTPDEKGFFAEMEKQKTRSRNASAMETGDWTVLFEDKVEEFVGYDTLETNIKIAKYRQVKQKGKTFYQLVFNITPFYAESGGQVGDTGTIKSALETIEIFDTKKENDLIVHFTEILPQYPDREFKALVDAQKRYDTANNHTATHLLHLALRQVLGNHVEQKGSLVAPDYLRFDFAHYQKISETDLKEIEHKVNSLIRANIKLEENRQMPLQKAKEMGAMALFGEKYGDLVRVIKFGESVELCGGTHVPETAQIGFFKIVSETAVAASIRRIEAISGNASYRFVHDNIATVNQIKSMLKAPDALQAVNDLLQKLQEANKKIEALHLAQAGNLKNELLNSIKIKNNLRFLCAKTEVDPKAFKDLAFQLKESKQADLILLANILDGKVALNLTIAEELVKTKNLHAGNLIREIAKEVGGSGGGQPTSASAGGTNVNGIDKAFDMLFGKV